MAHSIQVQKLHTFIGHKDCVYCLGNSSYKNHFLSAAGDGMLVLWDINNPDNGELIVKIPNSIYAINYIKQNNQLIIGQNFSGIHLIDLNTKKEVASLHLTESYIFDIQHFGDILLIATGNGEVHIVQYSSLSKLHTIKESAKSARSIAVNPVLKEFAVAYSDFSIRIFSLNSFSLLQTIQAHQNSVFTVKYSPDGKYLLSGSRDAHLKIWNCWNHYELHERVVAHMFAINSIDFSPNGLLFATGSMDKSIKIWSSIDFQLLKVLDKSRHAGHGTSVNKVMWLENEKLLSCSDDRTISLWEIKI